MSELAIVQEGGRLVAADEALRDVKRKLQAARDHRKRFESTWYSNLAFAAGKHWLKWSETLHKLVAPPELRGKELYSADVITEYRMAALGELGSDDDRPELLIARNDQAAEHVQRQLNKAVAWGWDNEWMGDDVLAQVNRLLVDMGTAGVRCRFDPTVGPVVRENVPHYGGRPLREEEALELLADGPNPEVEMRDVRQGRIVWEALSPFNLLVPPGVPHEKDFPWECVVRPVPLDTVKAEYGDVAADLVADQDIVSVLGMDASTGSAGLMPAPAQSARPDRLEDHVWLYTYYERPCPRYPDGRTIVFGSQRMKPLRIADGLPYRDASGTPCSGVVYFHWWRVSDRFWSRALLEVMKDVQRAVNKRRTQINEIIDRGLPFVIVQRNSPAKQRRGLAVELVEIAPNEREPKVVEGVRPGDWLYHDIEAAREDLEHATGIKGPRLGENPSNVTTYAQLALLNENDQIKRQTILKERKQAIAKLVELSVYDIRTYWGSERQIALAGDEETIDQFVFDANTVPDFFVVRVAKGASKPRSQAAEIKKIEDVWQAAIASGAVMESPHDWVEWLKASLEAGQALDLPEGGRDAHADKAELENTALRGGEQVPVQYYDQHDVHIPVHRELQMAAEIEGDLELWQRVEEHVQQHVLTAQQTAQVMASVATANSAGALPPQAAPPPGAV